MAIGGGQVGGAVSVQMFLLIFGLIFITNRVRVDSISMCQGKVSDKMGYSKSNTLILAGDWMIHREYNILYFWH